jgi:uncharacterized membrane protein YhhN
MGDLGSSLSKASDRTKGIAGIALVAAILFIWGELADIYWLRMITKPVPVLCMAYWVSTLRVRRSYQLAVAIGLLLSAAGDILLEIGPATFLLGLVAFLLGHVAYIVAFTRDSRALFLVRAALAYAYAAAMYGVLFLAGDLAAMAIPVLLYTLVISTMLWRAAARVGAPAVLQGSAWTGLAGALLFTASDSLLALNMFVAPIPLASLLIIITYWLGQLGIARSAWR